jgi:hypothetical protein
VTDSSGYGRQHYALAEDILPQIITPLEKKLGMFFCMYLYMREDVFLKRLIVLEHLFLLMMKYD